MLLQRNYENGLAARHCVCGQSQKTVKNSSTKPHPDNQPLIFMVEQRQLLEVTSHILTVWSALADTSCVPSGLNATLWT
jgi:hypothetical protein